MKKQKLILPAAAVLIAAAAFLTFHFTTAFLEDKEVADNIITIGKVDLEISEGLFEDSVITEPGSVLPKAPRINNTGNRDEFVFMKVTVPKSDVTLLYEEDDGAGHKKGQKISREPGNVELFKMLTEDHSYSLSGVSLSVFEYNAAAADKEGWYYLKSTLGTDENVYYFGYNKKIAPGGGTNTLFDKIQLKSFIDEELAKRTDDDQLKELTVDIKAYGIQADELGIDGLPEGAGLLTDSQTEEIFDIVEGKQVM